MTAHEYNDAKELIAELGSIHKAADALGMSYSTLRRQLLRYESAQAARVTETQSVLEPELTPETVPQLDPESLLPPDFVLGIKQLNIASLQREAERRRPLDNLRARYGLND